MDTDNETNIKDEVLESDGSDAGGSIGGEAAGEISSDTYQSENIQDMADSEMPDLPLEVTEGVIVKKEVEEDETDEDNDGDDNVEQDSADWHPGTIYRESTNDGHAVENITTIQVSSNTDGSLVNQIQLKTEVEEEDVSNVYTSTEMLKRLYHISRSDETAAPLVKQKRTDWMADVVGGYTSTRVSASVANKLKVVISNRAKTASQQSLKGKKIGGVCADLVYKVRAKARKGVVVSAQDICLVCSAPCSITKNRKIPMLPFCRKCKKKYFIERAIKKKRQKKCAHGGHCDLDYRQRMCSTCHFNKFQDVLKAEMLAFRNSNNVENVNGRRGQHAMTKRRRKPRTFQQHHKEQDWVTDEQWSDSDTESASEKEDYSEQEMRDMNIESQDTVIGTKSACFEPTVLIKPEGGHHLASDQSEGLGAMTYTDYGNDLNADLNSFRVFVYTCDHVCSKCNSSGTNQEHARVNHTANQPTSSPVLPPGRNTAVSEDALRISILAKLNEIAQVIGSNTISSSGSSGNVQLPSIPRTVPLALSGTSLSSCGVQNSINLNHQSAQTQSLSQFTFTSPASQPRPTTVPTFSVSLDTGRIVTNRVMQPPPPQ